MPHSPSSGAADGYNGPPDNPEMLGALKVAQAVYGKVVSPEDRSEGSMSFTTSTTDAKTDVVTTSVVETDRQRGWANPIRRHIIRGPDHIRAAAFIAPTRPQCVRPPSGPPRIRRHTPAHQSPRRRSHRRRAQARAPADPSAEGEPARGRRQRDVDLEGGAL